MSEKKTLAHHAASLCVTLTIVGNLLGILLANSDNIPAWLAPHVLWALFLMILSAVIGGILGIIALIGVRKHGRKGILRPAASGLVMSIIVYFQAAILCHAYVNVQAYFEIAFTQEIGDETLEMLVLGRASQAVDIDSFIDILESGLAQNSPKFSTVRKGRIPQVPSSLVGIFDNKQLHYTYISVDTDTRDGADFRLLFPSATTQQPSCDELIPAVEALRQATGQGGDHTVLVTCNEGSGVIDYP